MNATVKMDNDERSTSLRHNTSRVNLIFILLIVLFSIPSLISAAERTLSKTPADSEGPFYPVARQSDEDNDLIHVEGQKMAAIGAKLYLSGIVVNTQGTPLQGITIEIWQTDPEGRYKHPGDKSQGPREPNFQYWGKTSTSDDGTFSFTTLLPGTYNPRPAHIHFKVWEDQKLLLTSQIYFRTPGKENAPASPRLDLLTTELVLVNSDTYKAFFKVVL